MIRCVYHQPLALGPNAGQWRGGGGPFVATSGTGLHVGSPVVVLFFGPCPHAPHFIVPFSKSTIEILWLQTDGIYSRPLSIPNFAQ